jgi:hypothetical protein
MRYLSETTKNELDRLGYDSVPTNTRPDMTYLLYWNCPKHITLSIVYIPKLSEDWLVVAFDRYKNESISLFDIEGFEIDEKGRAHFKNDEDIIPFVEALNSKIKRNFQF